MNVQRMDAIVEPIEVGLPQQPVPQRKHHRWLSEEEEKAGKPLLLRPEGGDQRHGEIGSLPDSSHHPPD